MIVISLMVSTHQALGQLTSGNPIIKHIRSADPSAQVWNDGRVWIYASHDQDNATDYSTMDGYHVFSSYDLVNWTDHGEILHSRDVSWGNPNGGFMFAPDAAFKNGTYYLYFPHLANDWNWRVGVATSDKPEGPFTDIGRYIEGTDHIDPTCFVDDDGQAYLIWGGDSQDPKIARLKENMTELAEEPRVIEYGAGNFGEGPFMHKRDGIYYFSYTCHTCNPYQGYYAMGDNPYGPFVYKGELNLSPPGAQDHHSIIEYHDQWYYFYHVGNYNGGSLYRRNVCIDSLFYNKDGSLQEVVQTQTGVRQDLIGSTPGILIPGRIQAEAYFRQEGIDTLQVDDSTTVVTQIQAADCFDFVLDVLGSEEYMAEIKVKDAVVGSKIFFMVDEIAVDSIRIDVSADTLKFPLFLYQGKHTLKLLFSHSDTISALMDMDWIDLHGETRYYSISASTTDGGSISPEGTFYLTEGDSMEFYMSWDLYYQPDSLLIDEAFQGPVDTYTFRNVTGNHSIEARYSACSGTQLNPFIQVNAGDSLNTSDVSLYVGDDLRLMVEYEDPGLLSWLDPRGQSSFGSEIVLENIQSFQSGTYTAYLTNFEGCKNKLDFSVTVEKVVLDVYQAEQWSGKSGVLNEVCTDTEGGLHLGYIDNGDWSTYKIEIDDPGIYDVIARVATASSGGEIELSIEDQILGSVPVSNEFSNGWQDWYTTLPVEVKLEQGLHELKLTFYGGDGYLFNLNWFDLIYNRAIPVSAIQGFDDPSKELLCYPLAGGGGFGIKYYLEKQSVVSISLINLDGRLTRSLLTAQAQPAGNYDLTWNGNNDNGRMVPAGIYLLVFSANERREVRKVVHLSPF